MAPVALPDSCLRDWLHAASVDGKVLDKTMIKLEEEDVFEVEAILDRRTSSAGGTEYLVRWAGFGEADDTWEPPAHIAGAREKLRHFLGQPLTLRDDGLEVTVQPQPAAGTAANTDDAPPGAPGTPPSAASANMDDWLDADIGDAGWAPSASTRDPQPQRGRKRRR